MYLYFVYAIHNIVFTKSSMNNTEKSERPEEATTWKKFRANKFLNIFWTAIAFLPRIIL